MAFGNMIKQKSQPMMKQKPMMNKPQMGGGIGPSRPPVQGPQLAAKMQPMQNAVQNAGSMIGAAFGRGRAPGLQPSGPIPPQAEPASPMPPPMDEQNTPEMMMDKQRQMAEMQNLYGQTQQGMARPQMGGGSGMEQMYGGGIGPRMGMMQNMMQRRRPQMMQQQPIQDMGPQQY